MFKLVSTSIVSRPLRASTLRNPSNDTKHGIQVAVSVFDELSTDPEDSISAETLIWDVLCKICSYAETPSQPSRP